MPLYEYECVDCNTIVELRATVEQRDSQYCSHCGAYLNRLVSRPSFILKGCCWAKDGYIRKETKDDYIKQQKHEKKLT